MNYDDITDEMYQHMHGIVVDEIRLATCLPYHEANRTVERMELKDLVGQYVSITGDTELEQARSAS